MEYLVWWLIIGGLAGFFAGQLTKGRGFGVLGNIVMGIVGGFIGGFLLSLLGLAAYGLVGSLITATLGAVVLILIVNSFAGRTAE